MKKKMTALLLCSVMITGLLTGCGNGQPASENGNQEDNTENYSQLPNPVEAWEDLAAMEEAVGFGFPIPASFERYEYEGTNTIDRTIIEQILKGPGDEERVYLRKAKGSEDISGDYNDYDAEQTIWAGDFEVTGKGNDGLIMCATWQDGEFTYAGSFPGWDDEMVASLIYMVMEENRTENPDSSEPVVRETGEDVVLVEIPGPYGTIRAALIEGWKYSICEAGKTEMAMADYGIRFWPEGVTNGWLELGYTRTFGVCGTGLVTEERTLSGVKATEGHFDGNKLWDYIAFGEGLENLVVIQNEAEGWLEEYDEQIMTILNTLQFDPDAMQGAIGVYDPSSELESLGLQVIVAEASPNAAAVTFCQYDDSVKEELGYGNEFEIEVKKGDSWEAYPAKDANMAFTQELHIIPKNSVTEQKYEWDQYYGSLPAGDYRLKLHVVAEQKTYYVYAGFIVR